MAPKRASRSTDQSRGLMDAARESHALNPRIWQEARAATSARQAHQRCLLSLRTVSIARSDLHRGTLCESERSQRKSAVGDEAANCRDHKPVDHRTATFVTRRPVHSAEK